MSALSFDYLEVPGAAPPSLTLEFRPPTPGHVVRWVQESTAIVIDVPADEAALRELRTSRFWRSVRRRRRRFEETHGPLTARVVTQDDDLVAVLPTVRELFAQRWEGQHTSLPWRRPGGFAPYAQVLRAEAAAGRAELVVLEGAGRLLAFDWLFLRPPWAYCWQHASTRDPDLAAFGLGTQLDVHTLCHLASRGDVQHLDLMVGDAPDKRAWGGWDRPVLRRIEARDTALGRIQVRALVGLHRARIVLRDDHPERYADVKRAVHRLDVRRHVPSRRDVTQLTT